MEPKCTGTYAPVRGIQHVEQVVARRGMGGSSDSLRILNQPPACAAASNNVPPEDIIPRNRGLEMLADAAAAALATLRLRRVTRPRSRREPRPKQNRSHSKGVTYYKRTGRWEAHIWKTGKQIYLGAFSTEEKAARAYDRAAIHYRKIEGGMNFNLQDYKKEFKLLECISDGQLITMLRKQSAGISKPFPEYPRVAQSNRVLNIRK